ncbi:glutamine synthetase/guanido kinase [Cystobasidium minutum MCA 4210]|uniref:glutamine synthetase/guanido kinase n=1 Tax=Cystobasidium minutum MCA 4210 TaxID=1397322 RepID=UPI0034CECDC5|eukprot:jgi/Rhomi1/37288/CE37287_1864
MATENAPTTIEELEAALKDDYKVKLAGIDVDNVLRGKIMQKEKFLSCVKSSSRSFGFCSVVFGWDIHDQTYTKELSISNLSNGYRDIEARIDISTLRRIPYEGNIPLFLVTFIDPETGKGLHACPRALLQKVIGQLSDELSVKPYSGAEFEFFQFKETPASVHDKGFRNLQTLTPGMHGYSMLRTQVSGPYFHDVYDTCRDFGIPLEGWHTETGPGVYEAALAYTDSLRMADNAILFKMTCKALGYKYDIMPTFMAKPHNGLPGCSGHIHVSLQDSNGRNIFALEEGKTRDDAKWADLKYVSKECEWFLAGVLAGLPDIMPCLVPTINGYKRLVENFWAPVNVSWGYESRLASVRLISPPLASPKATRLEIRVPGADMNVHYAFAAIFALGLHGIKNKMELTIQPTSQVKPENHATAFDRLPRDLNEATQRFKAPNSLARQTLGDAFVDHFAGTREHEWMLYSQTVSDWELARYFELV